MTTTYHVINKWEPTARTRVYENSRAVSIFMLGRKTNQYFIIKTDDKGSRLVEPFTDCEISVIQSALDLA